MKRRNLFALMTGLSVLTALMLSGLSFAQPQRTYDVTITNITRGQVLSPPVVISHSEDFQLFTLGMPASDPLAALAEDGMTDPLTDYLDTLPTVHDYAVGDGMILPGESMTLEVSIWGPFKLISAAGMLVSTNDAFFAIHGEWVPWGSKTVGAEAYDAGSETNSEDCMYIPGPPCGNGGVRDTADAEGFVHIHAGIQGIGDLAPEEADWRNPVVEVTIVRQ